MEQLTRAAKLIKERMGEVTASQKLLFFSLAVVLAMGLFLVQQYAATPSLVPLLDASYAPEDQQAAARFLDQQGVTYETGSAGVVLVPTDQRPRLIAQMSQSPGALPSDKTLLFNSLIDKQSWTKSDTQNRQLEVIALQNEIASILSQWTNIRSASVIIDVPPRRTLGQPSKRPTAAVNVFSSGGISQQQVDAIASFVAGSRSGLTVERVRIVDGSTGRQHRARAENQLTAATTQELIASIEERKQRQVSDMLAYIPGVIVTVHAQVDATQRTSKKIEALPEGKGSTSVLATETSMEREDSQPVQAAETGVRPNTQANIFSSGAAGSATNSETTGETEFDTMIGTEQVSIVDPRGFATKINAVVNVPRDYFTAIWLDQQRRSNTDDAADAAADAEVAEPTDSDLEPIVITEIERITGDVTNVVDTSVQDGAQPGTVKVSMIPKSPALLGPGMDMQTGGILGGLTGGGPVDVPSLVKTLALGGLATLALGLVVITAIKSNKIESLPSAEELVGIPPTLEGEQDLIGEADAADPALTAIELDDATMEEKQILEQVTGVVAERPDDAARILSRWMSDHA